MISIFLYIFLYLKYLFNVYLTSNLLLVTVIDMTLLFWKYFRKVTACYQYCIVVLHGPTVLILLHVQQFFCMRWKCFVILYMFGSFKDEGHFTLTCFAQQMTLWPVVAWMIITVSLSCASCHFRSCCSLLCHWTVAYPAYQIGIVHWMWCCQANFEHAMSLVIVVQ